MGWEYELETDIRYLQGIEKGEEKKDIEKNIQFVTNLLVNNEFNFDMNTIAKLANVSVEFVENITKNLDKKSPYAWLGNMI